MLAKTERKVERFFSVGIQRLTKNGCYRNDKSFQGNYPWKPFIKSCI